MDAINKSKGFVLYNGGTTAVYPGCCLSLSCGRTECSECRNEPILLAFKAWVRDHAAVVADEIWSPNVYYATR